MTEPSAWTEVRVLSPLSWCELVGETLQLGPCTTVAQPATRARRDAKQSRSSVMRTSSPATSTCRAPSL